MRFSAACRQRVTAEGFAPPLAGASCSSGMWSLFKSSWLASLTMPRDKALPDDASTFHMWAVRKSLETFRSGRDLHTFACLCGQSRAYRLVRRRGRVAEGGGLLNREKQALKSREIPRYLNHLLHPSP